MGATGIIPVNKPSGISSYDVIRAVKSAIGKELKGTKVGHGGTLDNLASGVLPILIGEASKAFDFLLGSDKVYEAVIQLGAFTETDDREGRIIESINKPVGIDAVKSVLPRFVGAIEQLPPVYSALKIGGRRQSDLARDNVAFEVKPRTVTVHSIELTDFDDNAGLLGIRVTCSSGTYIRSIARDVGKALGSGGYIWSLKRTRSAGIGLEECVPLDGITAENWKSGLYNLNSALSFLPALKLSVPESHITQGKNLGAGVFAAPPSSDGVYRVLSGTHLLALIEKKDSDISYLRVFNGVEI